MTVRPTTRKQVLAFMTGALFAWSAVAANAAWTATTTNRHAAAKYGTWVVADTTPPTRVDIQGTNGPGSSHTLDTGDVLTYTFSEPMKASSIIAGWNGTTPSTNLRISITACNTAAPLLTVNDATTNVPVNLGTVNLGISRNSSSTCRFEAGTTATMTGNTVRVVFGTQGGTYARIDAVATLTWTATGTAPTDLAGNPLTNASATEGGTADADF